MRNILISKKITGLLSLGLVASLFMSNVHGGSTPQPSPFPAKNLQTQTTMPLALLTLRLLSRLLKGISWGGLLGLVALSCRNRSALPLLFGFIGFNWGAMGTWGWIHCHMR